jgi:hypothetical protein
MKKFFKKLWDTWTKVQVERAKWFAEHGSAWE